MKRNEVESMTGPELVALYRKLTGKSVARFASRADGVRRCLAALPAAEEAAEPAPAPAAPAKAATPTKAPRTAPKPRLLPAQPGGKAPRPGSKRAAALAMLQCPEGATLGELAAEFGWSAKDATDCVHLLAKKNGASLARDEAGRWRVTAVAEASEPAPVRGAAQPGTKRRKTK